MQNEDPAVTKFRDYLKINTEQPTPDYEACNVFLRGIAHELQIQTKVVYTSPTTPFFIMTIPGSRPEAPSLMLYSHTDVVPTFREHWIHDPYSAFKDEEGNIFARGAQDMKCVGSQYVEAIRRHFNRGKRQWTRTIHLVWGADEETASPQGMVAFVETKDFEELNIGFVLDEGIASENGVYKVFYGERYSMACKITCEGSPGHGSKFIENTAGEKLQSILNSALGFRESERKRMLDGNLQLGDVTSLNLTIIEGGVQINVLPEKFAVQFDIRVPPVIDFDDIEGTINDWCKRAGKDVKAEFLYKRLKKNMTDTSAKNPWWVAFEGALKKQDCNFTKEIFTASTDSRFLRSKGYQSIGFSPIINTTSLLHDHNEFLNEKVFLKGIDIYESIIDNLASVE